MKIFEKINQPVFAAGGSPVYQFGCGRFLLTDGKNTADGLRKEVGTEIRLLGKRALIVGGHKALLLTHNAITESMAANGIDCNVAEYNGQCCPDYVQTVLGNYHPDVVVGVGGGRIMDFAKLCAYVTGVPTVNIPTSSATCASVTSLSVLYDAAGKTIGTLCYERGVQSVIADLSILRIQPPRLAAAGMLDTMAKRYEIEHYTSTDPGLAAARSLAQDTFNKLRDHENRDLQELVYLCLPITGIISGMSRGRNQSHLAHGLYESVRSVFTNEGAGTLHSELVAIGLFLQLAFDGRTNEIADLRKFMRGMGMPVTLVETGIADTLANRKKLLLNMLDSPYLEEPADNHERLKTALEYVWREL